jgi:hypothetical protein
MTPLSVPRSLALTILLGSLGLSGCGGSMNFPDAVPSQQADGPAVHMTVYGGHAPIVGAHVYLLQPGTAGYGSAATSLLGNNGATSAQGYALTADVNDPNVTVGAKYVTSDSTGSVNFTGAYKCTVGQPVYSYSYGGSATGGSTGQIPSTTTTTYDISGAVTIANPSTTTGQNGTATYTFTSSTPENFQVGTQVTFANSSPVTGTLPVTKVESTTNFSVVASNYVGANNGNYGNQNQYLGAGNYTNPGGTATATTPSSVSNPVVELATLGVCPSSGNFSTPGNGALSFIYANEVSTVATAYTFQPFTTPGNSSAWNIGTSGTTQAITGIDNAALTAAQLYSIQGNTQISSTNDGEGHIANYQTQLNGVANQGNGVVPQATIDTLANILAACIDSPLSSGLSTQCTTLFNTATNGGSTVASGDTAATDTATAAINIARYPAGNSSGTPSPTYVTDLYGIPTGTVPYAPTLSAAPHDWTLAIDYPGVVINGYTASNGTIKNPFGVGVDGVGQIWFTDQGTNDLFRWSSLGAQTAASPLPYHVGTVSVDGNNNAWTGYFNNGQTGVSAADYLYEANSAAPANVQYGEYAEVQPVTDKAGDAFFFGVNAASGATNKLFEYPNNSSSTATPISLALSNAVSANGVYNSAIDSSGDIWAANYGNKLFRVSSTTGATAFTPVGLAAVSQGIAIDASGNAWVAQEGNTSEIYEFSPTGAQTTLTNTGASLAAGAGVAIDGNDHVWVLSNASVQGTGTRTDSIAVIDAGTGKAISPATNYQPQYGTAPTAEFDGVSQVAIDPSGDIWITNYQGGRIVEMVGAAAPVVTPLSVAAGTNKLGQKP